MGNNKKDTKKGFLSSTFILFSLPFIGIITIAGLLVAFIMVVGSLQASGALSDCTNDYADETESISAISSSDASGIDPFTPGTKAYENAKAFFEKGIESGIGGIAMAGMLGNINSEGSFDIIGRAEGHYTMTEADSIANGAVPGNSGYGYAVGGGGIWQITPYTDYAPLNSPDWEDIDKMWQFMVDRINGVHPSSPGWKDWVNSYDYSGKNRSFIEWAMDTNIEDAAPGWNAHERGAESAIRPALPRKIADSKKFAELFNAEDYPADESKLKETFPAWFGGNASYSGSPSTTGEDDEEAVNLTDYDDEEGNGSSGADEESDGEGSSNNSGDSGDTISDSDDAQLWEETADESNPEEAGLKSHVAHAKRFLAKKFGITEFSLFREDNEGTGFGHGSGYSIDLMCDLETGKQITDYIATKEFMKNMQIFYIMHNHKTFFDRTNIYGDAYTWNDVPDRGSATANHEDHVHITFDGNQDGNIHPEGGGMISSGKSAKSNNKKNKCNSSSGGYADGGHPYKNDYYLASGFHKYSFGFGGMGTGHHSGVDLTGEPTGVGSQHPSNDEIFAVLDGEVVRDGNNDYGIIIIKTEGIGDEPLYLEYTHTVVGSSQVSVGDKVSKGDLIAQEGETGSNLSTGCQPCFHLHFGVTYGVDNAYAYYTDDSAYSTDLSAKIIDPGYVLPGVGEGWLMTTHENYVGDDAIPFKIQVDGNTQHPRGLTADDAIK